MMNIASFICVGLSQIYRQSLERRQTKGFGHPNRNSPTWKVWAGYAFESICYKHMNQIRHALNINPGAHVGTWRIHREKENDGAQIDLLFDRPDGAITLCEIKCFRQPLLRLTKPMLKIS